MGGAQWGGCGGLRLQHCLHGCGKSTSGVVLVACEVAGTVPSKLAIVLRDAYVCEVAGQPALLLQPQLQRLPACRHHHSPCRPSLHSIWCADRRPACDKVPAAAC